MVRCTAAGTRVRKGNQMAENPNDAGMGRQVKAVIDHIRPLLQADGGDIELVGVDEPTGTVSVRLQGACRGCPSAAMTLRMGVERHLKEKVPAVKKLVAVE
jgi:Fe-S cluster biogenesis protein NfuA